VHSLTPGEFDSREQGRSGGNVQKMETGSRNERNKVNLSKTKLLVTGKEAEIIETGQFPCAVCGQTVGVNSKLCNNCSKWCHKCCSALRSLNVPSSLCPSCSNQGRTSQPDDSIHLHDGQEEEVKRNWKKLSNEVTAECFDIWQV